MCRGSCKLHTLLWRLSCTTSFGRLGRQQGLKEIIKSIGASLIIFVVDFPKKKLRSTPSQKIGQKSHVLLMKNIRYFRLFLPSELMRMNYTSG